jgi:hypothetical protein
MRKFVRLKNLFGAGGAIPVGRSKFGQDYVLRDEADPFIPGTAGVRRLRLVQLGPRSFAAEEGDIAALLDALAAQGRPPVQESINP